MRRSSSSFHENKQTKVDLDSGGAYCHDNVMVWWIMVEENKFMFCGFILDESEFAMATTGNEHVTHHHHQHPSPYCSFP